MTNLSGLEGKTLELFQPKFTKDNYELKSGEPLIGTIGFPKVFSTNADVVIDEKSWEIKKESFWKGILGVYKPGSELPYAKYTPTSFTKGEVKLYRGEYIQFKQYILKDILEVRNSMGQLIFTIRSKSGIKKKHFIDIQRKNKILDENPWIILLACYILIRKEKAVHSAVHS